MTTTPTVTYAWVPGRERAVPAGLVAAVVLDLERRNGVCRPGDLVDEARRRDHPLHDLAEWRGWNPQIAAEAWWTHQARRLINSVEIILDDGTRGPAFSSIEVVIAAGGRRGYIGQATIALDDQLEAAVLDEVRRTLNGWRRRYTHLRTLWDRLSDALDD